VKYQKKTKPALWTMALATKIKTRIVKPIRYRSKSMTAKMVEYNKQKKRFLARPENRFCCRFPNQIATEIHHKFGRAGSLLLDERGWLPASEKGHRWIHNNPDKARDRGLLAPIGGWNKPL